MTRRVLIVRTGAMGDVLHGLPAVMALRQSWPEAALDWVVDPRWAPLLVNEAGQGPVVSRVHLAETRLWSKAPVSAATARSVRSLRQALRAGAYDAVVDVQGTLRSAVIGRFAGARHFAGFADPREKAARWLYRQALPRRGSHVVEQNAVLLGGALGVDLRPAPAMLPVRSGAGRRADEMMREAEGKKIVLLAPTAGWGAKQWPAQCFGELARELGAAGWCVRVNAASEADLISRAVVQASRGAAQLLCCGVAELIEVTRRADAVIAGDTGPMHLAAALGRPVVALFGPTDPARNGPWGPGPKRILRDSSSATSYKRDGAADAGLAKISVKDVHSALLAVDAEANAAQQSRE